MEYDRLSVLVRRNSRSRTIKEDRNVCERDSARALKRLVRREGRLAVCFVVIFVSDGIDWVATRRFVFFIGIVCKDFFKCKQNKTKMLFDECDCCN